MLPVSGSTSCTARDSPPSGSHSAKAGQRRGGSSSGPPVFCQVSPAQPPQAPPPPTRHSAHPLFLLLPATLTLKSGALNPTSKSMLSTLAATTWRAPQLRRGALVPLAKECCRGPRASRASCLCLLLAQAIRAAPRLAAGAGKAKAILPEQPACSPLSLGAML